MKVDYSKEFEKSLKKLSGKMLDSIRRVITEVKQAENIKDITDCTKLVLSLIHISEPTRPY